MSEYAGALAGLASSISDGDVSSSDIREYLYDVYSLEGVRSEFEHFGIRWNSLVEADVVLVLSGYEPRFFRDHFEVVDDYRLRRSITVIDHERRKFVYGRETVGLAVKYLDRIARQRDEYGVTTDQFEMGFACRHEQSYFYQQQEWIDRAAVARYHAGYKCERCGQRNMKLHVHHRTPIISAWHHNFVLNFAWWKLETLCERCHQWTHERTVRSTAAYQFIHAKPETVAEERETLRKLHSLHDKLKECPFCFGGNAEYHTLLAIE